MIRVWLVDLAGAATALDALERNHPRLSVNDLEHIAALNHSASRRERALTTIALRAAIAHVSGDDALARQPFTRLSHGKPVLAGAPLSFSTAHAAGRAIVALGAVAAPIGVDLERERSLRMTPDRRARLVAAARSLGDARLLDDDPTTDAAVLQSWVRLEALGKARGCGIGAVLTEAGVLGGGRSSVEARRASTNSAELARISVSDLAVPARAGDGRWFAALAAPLPMLAAATEVVWMPTDVAALATFARA